MFGICSELFINRKNIIAGLVGVGGPAHTHLSTVATFLRSAQTLGQFVSCHDTEHTGIAQQVRSERLDEKAK